MKFYSKLHIVEAIEITEICESDSPHSYLVKAESGDTFDVPESAKVGDFIVLDEDDYVQIMPKTVFQNRYASMETAVAETVALEDIQAKVISESFGVEGNMVVSFVSLDNGFKTSGHSFCIHDEEFNEGIGKGVAFRNATEKLWELEGYHRMQHAHDISVAVKNFETKREAND